MFLKEIPPHKNLKILNINLEKNIALWLSSLMECQVVLKSIFCVRSFPSKKTSTSSIVAWVVVVVVVVVVFRLKNLKHDCFYND